MDRNVYFIYDDTIELPINIKNIVGDISFGEIINKKEKLKTKLKQLVSLAGINNFIIIKNEAEKKELLLNLKKQEEEQIVIHFFAKSVVINQDKFVNFLHKLVYSHNIIVNRKTSPQVLSFLTITNYEKFITMFDYSTQMITDIFNKDDEISTIDTSDFITDISNLGNFLSFFSGGFDARYFNQLYGDEYTLVKKSTDKEKIRKEYLYYHLLPDELKTWFVMPYNLVVEEDFATYKMERLNVPDVALQWIHQSITIKEFDAFIAKVFNYVTNRPKRIINKQDYYNRFENLYYQKVIDRIEQFRNLREFEQIDTFVRNGTNYTVEDIIDKYKSLFDKLYNRFSQFTEVIGHGDLCFSNILYDKNSYVMKFIDTKGALEEKDLWTDPFYDLAKLSHSILGKYDFINNGLFEISLNNECKFELHVKENPIHNMHQQLFINKLNEHGIDVRIVRLCESSLFLSMLPLHIDNPRKVFGFILNAINILEELESNV